MFFRATARLLAAAPAQAASIPNRTKVTTGIVGLAVHPSPFAALRSTYSSTLSILSQMPPAAVYRQAAESITKDRLAAIESLGGAGDEAAIEAVEKKIGAGQIEEVVAQAEDELSLAGKMLEWKAWEDLQDAPAPGQWDQFKTHPSTTMPDDLKNSF